MEARKRKPAEPYISQFECKAIDLLLKLGPCIGRVFAVKYWGVVKHSSSKYSDYALKGAVGLNRMRRHGLVYSTVPSSGFKSPAYHLWHVTELGILLQHNYLARYGEPK